MDVIMSGQVTAILPAQTGVSQRNGQPWMSQEYVVCHEPGQYPKSVCFRIFGEDKIKQFNIQMGEQITVHLNIDCRQGQKGFFNSIDCWKVERPQMQGYQQMPQQGGFVQQSMQQMPAQNPFPPQGQQQVQQQQMPQAPAQNPFPQQPMQQQVQQPAPGAAPFPPQMQGQQPIQGTQQMPQQQAAPQGQSQQLPF